MLGTKTLWACVVSLSFIACTPTDTGPGPDDSEDTDEPIPETYAGGWYKAACADEVEGTGTAAGDVALDFSQPDQFGESLRLYDFCDRTVLLVGAAFW